MAELEHNVSICMVNCVNINSRIERFFIGSTSTNCTGGIFSAVSITCTCIFTDRYPMFPACKNNLIL